MTPRSPERIPEGENRQDRFRLLTGFLEWAHVDRAVGFALLAKAWQVMAAPVTILLIAAYLTPELQGFYYTFYSLLALQAFVELGLYTVIILIASHEWAHLELDPSGRLAGAADAMSRLISLGRLAFKWYAIASAGLMVVVGAAGYLFLSRASTPDVTWQAPWIIFVAISALLLWVLPFVSLLEGCNQLVTINRFRVSQVVLSSCALWLTLALGGGLWAVVASAATSLIRDIYLLLVQYRAFFKPFFEPPSGSHVDWKSEVWPLQWKFAVYSVLGYFSSYLYGPVIFYYYGPAAAGRIGMTWTLVLHLTAISWAWVSTKVPRFGVLIEKRDYPTLDRLFFVTTAVTTVLMTAGGFALWWLVLILDRVGHPLAERVLGPTPTALLVAGAVLMHVTRCQSSYMRAHKEEPGFVFAVVSYTAIGFLVWLLGSRYGPMGAVLAFTLVQVVFVVGWTLIWQRNRRRWQGE